MKYEFANLPLEPLFKLDGRWFDFDIFVEGAAYVELDGFDDDDFKITSIELEATSRHKPVIGNPQRRPEYCRITISLEDPATASLYERVATAIYANLSTEIVEDLTTERDDEKQRTREDYLYEQAKERRMEAGL